jgi:hypothetical protein
VWSTSYSFLGPHYEGAVPARWAREARKLAGRFPADGASFSAAWQRVSTS